MERYQIVHTVLAVALSLPLLLTAASWIHGMCDQNDKKGLFYALLSSMLLILYGILITLNDQYGPRIQMSQAFAGIPFFYYFTRFTNNLLEFLICLVVVEFQCRCIGRQRSRHQ